MTTSRQASLDRIIAGSGHSFEGKILIGGNYVPVLRDGGMAYVSGQVPRVGDKVVVTGRVGAEVSLQEARNAAQICTIRALVLLRQELGSLDRIAQVLRVGVFVQCAESFSQQSEVADAASELLHAVLGPAGAHARTSVGVYALPKHAAVELEMVVRLTEEAAHGG